MQQGASPAQEENLFKVGKRSILSTSCLINLAKDSPLPSMVFRYSTISSSS